MAEPKKSGSSKKIVDVEQPNTTAPSPTSKPVLVTNRPIMQDPMVKEDSGEDAGTPIKVTTGSTRIKLQPLTEPQVKPVDKPEPTEATPDPVSKDEPQAGESAPAPNEPAKTDEPVAPAKPEAKPEEPAETPSETPASPAPEQPAGDTASNDTQDAEVSNKEAAAEAEQAKHDEAMQKLIDSKQYFLPINAVEKRRTQRVVLLGVVVAVLLAVAWVDIALDAGLIQLGSVKPVTHFFTN